MAKELTLEELANMNDSKVDITNTQPVETNENINTNETVNVSTPSNEDFKGARQVSIDELSKGLPGRPQEEEKPPVVVENALKSMYDRLEQSKKDITEKYVPAYIEAEIAKKREAEGKTPIGEEEQSKPELDDINLNLDDLEFDDEDEQEEEEVETRLNIPTMEEPEPEVAPINEPVIDSTPDLEPINEQPKVKVEPIKINTPVTESVTEDTNIEDDVDKDIAELDKLINQVDELSEEIEDVDDEAEMEATKKRFKKSLSKIKVVNDEINLAEFKVRQKPISASTVLNNVQVPTVKEADWVALESGRSFRMRECSGKELDALKKSIDNSNNINGVIITLKFIYNHIVDVNKPSFETWCKITRTEDLESYYFALYKATYSDTNLVARTCTNDKCKKTFIEDTDINAMVKFKDDETEERFMEIAEMDTNTDSPVIASDIVVASDSIAIAYTQPTLYNTFIQFSTLPNTITDKYSDLLNSLAYITDFYYINKETK